MYILLIYYILYRWGYMAVASGMHDTVIVAGVEQMTHQDAKV
jgi:acetyl-CoA acetyltransferase